VSPVEYAGGKCSLLAYIAVCLQIHCNPSSLQLQMHLFTRNHKLWNSAITGSQLYFLLLSVTLLLSFWVLRRTRCFSLFLHIAVAETIAIRPTHCAYPWRDGQ